MKRVAIALGVLLCSSTTAFSQPFGGGPPKVKPSLFASVKQVVPGQPFDVAIRMEVEAGWHVYWSNPGDSGMSPSAKWTLPEGSTAGPLRYPVPKKHVTDLGGQPLVTYILEGKPVLLTTITPPPALTGDRFKVQLDLRWLVCKESCVPEDKSLRLELPVAAAGSAPAADNADVFKQAASAMPAVKSEYVSLKVTASPLEPTPGKTFDLLIEAQIKPEHHIQSDRPSQPGLIAAEVTMDATEGIKFGPPKFPPAHEREVEGLGKLSEFSGTITIKVPCVVRDDPPKGPVTIAGLLTFQACTDKGQCYPAQTLAFSWSSAGGAAAPSPGAGPQKPDASQGPGAAQPTGGAEPPPSAVEKPPATADTGESGAALTETSGVAAASTAVAPETGLQTASADADGSILLYLLFGFLGGLILNVMPCVLPVISIKILSFVQQAGEDRGRVLRLGLSFCAGIMAWFWVFACVTLFWTPPLQNPGVVIGLTAIMFVFGLSLFGVWEMNLPGFAAQAAGDATEKEGYGGAFMKGLLATLLGTACTAPLLAGALSWASTQPKVVAFAVFTAAGVGMALPYFLLSANPGWMKFLPRPGNWMITFKQFMGFLLVGTAVWLLMTVAAQLGGPGVVQTVSFLTFLAVSCWMIGKIGHGWSIGRQLRTWLAAAAVALLGGWFSFAYLYNTPLHWVEYRKGLAEELASQGHTVLVDYTATWCATCKTNKALAIEVNSTVQLINALKVVAIHADYSKTDPEIEQELKQYGRPSVPMCLVYAADKPKSPELLPTLLTPSVVQDALQRAGPSRGDATPLLASQGE
ncbi:MAG: thioredoxin family protein [Phycisphaerales bacterium]|nr:thioredoxin family protein [Phycisphaerales bacterium]